MKRTNGVANVNSVSFFVASYDAGRLCPATYDDRSDKEGLQWPFSNPMNHTGNIFCDIYSVPIHR